jgi:hypothetical protein
LQRFTGTCEPFADLDSKGVMALSEWIVAIPLEDWPQQKPHGVMPLQPAMMSNQTWYGFGKVFDPLVAGLLRRFPGCIAQQRMLSVVMPGDAIPPHIDHQCPEWICRVHVPLTASKQSVFIMDDGEHCMEVGKAYKVNTEATHAVRNTGTEPRIHFMFDIRTI